MKNTIGGILLGVAMSTPQGKEIINQGGKVLLQLGSQALKSKGIDLQTILKETSTEVNEKKEEK